VCGANEKFILFTVTPGEKRDIAGNVDVKESIILIWIFEN
jgi:hypothetical protein